MIIVNVGGENNIMSVEEAFDKYFKGKNIDDILKAINDKEYEYYYYPTYKDYLKKALENERNYRCNCSDFIKDFSLEATNRRIWNDIKRMKEEE